MLDTNEEILVSNQEHIQNVNILLKILETYFFPQCS